MGYLQIKEMRGWNLFLTLEKSTLRHSYNKPENQLVFFVCFFRSKLHSKEFHKGKRGSYLTNVIMNCHYQLVCDYTSPKVCMSCLSNIHSQLPVFKITFIALSFTAYYCQSRKCRQTCVFIGVVTSSHTLQT